MQTIGWQSLLQIISHFIFIFLTFWAMDAFHIEKWIRKGYEQQARILYILVAITIGYAVSSFVLEIILSSQNLMLIF